MYKKLPQSAAFITTRAALVALISAVACIVLSTPAAAFEKGSVNGGITLGAGRALDRDYTVIGGRIGYFIADGFEFAFAGEMWRGNDPNITKFTPELRYVWYQLVPVKPYVGGFISRTLYDGLPDRNTYGAKGGVYLPVGPNAHLSAGLVYERIESCSQSTYRDCSQWYPEFGFNVTF